MIVSITKIFNNQSTCYSRWNISTLCHLYNLEVGALINVLEHHDARSVDPWCLSAIVRFEFAFLILQLPATCVSGTTKLAQDRPL